VTAINLRGKAQVTTRRATFAWGLLALVIAASAGAGKIKFDRLSLEEGLSQGSANAVLQDRQGFLWIGTQDGLSRWNSYEIETFRRDVEDEASLADNFVVALLEDSDGTIWVFHRGGRAVTLLDPTRLTFRRLVHDPNDPQSLAAANGFAGNDLLEDERGRSWLATRDVGFNLIDRATLRVEHLRHDPENPESLPDDNVSRTLETEDGAYWIGTDSGLARRQPPAADGSERFAVYRHDAENPQSLPSDEVVALLEDPDGSLWVGTTQGFAHFDPESETFARYLQGDDYPVPEAERDGRDPIGFPALVDQRGWLWVGTIGGLSVLDRASAEIRHYQVDRDASGSLSSPNVQGLIEDQIGDLWIITGGGGVNRYLPEDDAFEVFMNDPTDSRSLTNNIVNSIYESPAGILYFGTFGGGLSSFPTRHPMRFGPHETPHAFRARNASRFASLEGFGSGGVLRGAVRSPKGAL
jgi:ligand-binding sensor domain-containing protein